MRVTTRCFLSNFAGLRLRDNLARVPGVADVSVFGIGQYSMRVWLDAAQMSQRGLNPSDHRVGHRSTKPDRHRRTDRNAAGAGGSATGTHDQCRFAADERPTSSAISSSIPLRTAA